MFFYVFVVFYTQLLVPMLQYHISTTKHSTVPVFIRYVLLFVLCILPTITSTNGTISHINKQTFYRSLVYTVCYFMFVVFYTQLLVLMLQYHISTTKHSTVPVFIRYVLLCVCCILHTITCTNVTISHINNQILYPSLVYAYVLLCVCCILHTITCTNATISHINNQTFYRSLVYTLYSVMCLLYFTHNHLYQCYNITYQQPNILPFLCLYGMFFYVCVVFYTQSLVLMLQYHISTKHSTVPLFIRYVLLCVCCILHTITSTNLTISHITNQTFHRCLVYTVCSVMYLLYFTHNH